MNQQKLSPTVLRLLVIFPNVMSYMLLIGVIIYIMTNYNGLQQAGALSFWLIILIVLTPMSLFTTFSIARKMRAGQL